MISFLFCLKDSLHKPYTRNIADKSDSVRQFQLADWTITKEAAGLVLVSSNVRQV